jgi:hypothetical protein
MYLRLRSCHSNIEEPNDLIQLLLRAAITLVWKNPIFQSHHDHRLKLQPFGTVQRHQVDLVWTLSLVAEYFSSELL